MAAPNADGPMLCRLQSALCRSNWQLPCDGATATGAPAAFIDGPRAGGKRQQVKADDRSFAGTIYDSQVSQDTTRRRRRLTWSVTVRVLLCCSHQSSVITYRASESETGPSVPHRKGRRLPGKKTVLVYNDLTRDQRQRQLVLGDALAASLASSLPGALSSSNPKPRSRQRRFLKGDTASVWYRWQSGWYGANVNKQSQRAVFPHTKNTRTRMSYT